MVPGVIVMANSLSLSDVLFDSLEPSIFSTFELVAPSFVPFSRNLILAEPEIRQMRHEFKSFLLNVTCFFYLAVKG